MKTISAIAKGAALGTYTSTADITCTAHGYAEGDIVSLFGTGCAAADGTTLDGMQRVDRVVDANTFRCCVEIAAGATPPAATALKQTYTTNPVICVRDYLVNRRYGIQAGSTELGLTSEVDDTALIADANYCDELVYVSSRNTASFRNRRRIVDIVVAGGTATVTLESAHSFAATNTVRISGMGNANLDGVRTVVATPTGTTLTFATAAANGTYTPAVVTINHAGGGSTVTHEGYCSRVRQVKRYECNGALDTAQERKKCLEDLLSSCRGYLVYQAGLYRTFIRRPVTPSSFELNESNIVGDWEFSDAGQDELANIVRATFFNEGLNGELDFVEWPQAGFKNQFLEDDNFFELRREIELPCTNLHGTAQHIAMITRRESRSGKAFAVTCTEAVLQEQIGSVVPVTHATPGWSGKLFWIMAMAHMMDGLVRVVGVEYDASAYDLEADDDDPFEPDTTLPNPLAVAPPVSLTLTTDPTQPRILVAVGSAPDDYVVRYELQVQESGATSWTQAPDVSADSLRGEIVVTPGKVYSVRARSVNAAGQRSDWFTVTNHAVHLKPAPIVGTLTAESTALGGAGAGMVHIPLTFEKNATEIWVYFAQSASSGVAAPELVPANLAVILKRAEGIAAGEAFATEIDIAGVASNYLKAIIRGYGPGGTGDPVVQEIRMLDSGTPPSAPPTGPAVDMATTPGTAKLTWTNGDAAALTRVRRNGLIIKRDVAAGTASYDDVGITPGVAYTYEVQHIRNGQTSAWVTVGGTGGTPTLATPTWQDGYPFGYYEEGPGGLKGPGLYSLAWVNPDPAAETEIYESAAASDAAYSLVHTAPAGQSSVALGGSYGDTRWFYLKAKRTGYTTSGESTHLPASIPA